MSCSPSHEQDYVTVDAVEGDASAQFAGKDLRATIAELEKRMRAAAADLEFEEAARLRDEIKRMEALDLGLEPNLAGRSLQDSTPRAGTKPKAKQDWKPKPMVLAAAATIRRRSAADGAPGAAPDRQVRRLHGILRRRVQPGGVDTLGRPPWLG